jgi:hypothetical protein
MPVPVALTSRRTEPCPDSGPTVTSIVEPAAETPLTAPLRLPLKTGVKSAASTPPTPSLNVTRNVMLAALLAAAVGFSRVTETTSGATVSTVTANAGDDGLLPAALLAAARNAYAPSASAVPL